MVEANVAAAKFYRRELLRTTNRWPLEYLKASGAEQVLSTESGWKVGYAPGTWTSLVDHLRAQGFGFATLVRAGLVQWTADGEAVDRHRDQLVLVARDQRLSPVGFIGISQDEQTRSLTPVTAIHRPSNVLVGVGEQLELLGRGAIPVIVDEPIDAIALSNASRQTNGQWVGIPVCGAGLSTAQARMLHRFSASDRVVVALSGYQRQRNQSAGHLLDLAFFFDRVRAVELPGSPSALSSSAARGVDPFRRTGSL